MPRRAPQHVEPDTDDEQDELPERSPGYTALKLKQNNHTIYYLTIPVSELVRYCYVSRRSEDFDSGFQRNLSESRADEIAAYLKGGDGSVPSNIVLSAQASSELEHDGTSKGLSFMRTKGAFLVIDGQHTAYAATRSQESTYVSRSPCTKGCHWNRRSACSSPSTESSRAYRTR